MIVHDFVSKVAVSRFQAHESPMFALCFDPTVWGRSGSDAEGEYSKLRGVEKRRKYQQSWLALDLCWWFQDPGQTPRLIAV